MLAAAAASTTVCFLPGKTFPFQGFPELTSAKKLGYYCSFGCVADVDVID